MSFTPAAAMTVMILAPMAGACVVLAWNRARNAVTVAASLLTLLAAWPVAAEVMAGRTVQASLPWPVLPDGVGFVADGLSMTLAAVSALVWLAAGLAAVDYLRDDARGRRYGAAYLLTLTGVLGTFFAGDFLTLLLFFEVMTLASYLLVVHKGTGDAMSAGGMYLYMSLAGGLVVALGAALLWHTSGSLAFAAGPAGGWMAVAAACLMMAGFAVKAGLFPLHVWLPLAHPVAPAPASAVLSGIMIKTGGYGVLRALMTAGHDGPGHTLALILLIMAAVTMLAGVSLALLQSDAKRMLAYHSVSQMGYIMMGIALVVYLGPTDPLGLAGGLFHIVNHALFKSALFMIAGAVYLRTGHLDMYKMGGLWRQMPVTAVLAFVAACGIAGVPGFNGYISKTLLHHGIEHAVYQSGALRIVEWVFMLTGAGTACSFIKFCSFIFLGRPRWPGPLRSGGGIATTIGIAIPAALVIYLGLRPEAFLSLAVAPTTQALGYAPVYLKHGLFTAADLQGIATCLIGGAVIFVLGTRLGWFHVHLPAPASVTWLASRAGLLVGTAFAGTGRLAMAATDGLLMLLRGTRRLVPYLLKGLDTTGGTALALLYRTGRQASRILGILDTTGGSPLIVRGIRLSNVTFGTALVLTVLTAILFYRIAVSGMLFGR